MNEWDNAGRLTTSTWINKSVSESDPYYDVINTSRDNEGIEGATLVGVHRSNFW